MDKPRDEEGAALPDAGSPDEIGPRVLERYGDLVQRVSFDTSAQLDGDRVSAVLAGFRT